MSRRSVNVKTSRYALDGRHLWGTITSGEMYFEYKARNMFAARTFIETTLEAHFPGCEILTSGDTQIFFSYMRDGD